MAGPWLERHCDCIWALGGRCLSFAYICPVTQTSLLPGAFWAWRCILQKGWLRTTAPCESQCCWHSLITVALQRVTASRWGSLQGSVCSLPWLVNTEPELQCDLQTSKPPRPYVPRCALRSPRAQHASPVSAQVPRDSPWTLPIPEGLSSHSSGHSPLSEPIPPRACPRFAGVTTMPCPQPQLLCRPRPPSALPLPPQAQQAAMMGDQWHSITDSTVSLR